MLDRKRKVFYVGSLGDLRERALLGGQRVTLDHVRHLRLWGYEAYAVASFGRTGSWRVRRLDDPDFVIEWRKFAKLLDPKVDVVVVPGRHLCQIDDLPGNNKVVFSQGAFITLGALPLDVFSHAKWRSPSLRAILCASDGNREILAEMRPRCPVLVVPTTIEPDGVAPQRKRPLLLYPSLARVEKNPWDTKVVLDMLHARSAHKGGSIPYDFSELADMSFDEVQDLMKEARVLLFLGLHEGLPLTVLEALSHDVIVLGFNRRPMTDLLHPRCVFEIGQLLDIARTAESIMNHPDDWADVVAWNRRQLLEFGREQHEAALQNAYSVIEAEILRAG